MRGRPGSESGNIHRVVGQRLLDENLGNGGHEVGGQPGVLEEPDGLRLLVAGMWSVKQAPLTQETRSTRKH